jgi:nucleotide-binding universal stress UspA family protein
MMLFNKQLLLVMDQQDQACLALQRSRLIASRLNCSIEIVWVGEDADKASQLVTQLESEGITASFRCTPKSKLLKLLEELWAKQRFGLLVKSCDPRKSGFMTSLDGQILRDLPCPVLMVKHDHLWHEGVVMAAVNPLTTDQHQQQLNDDLLKVAAQIARVTDSSLTGVVACPSPMMGADPQLQSAALIEKQARRAIELLLSQLKLGVEALAVGEGPAEHWIPKVADELEARLVVIGTRAHGGLKGALLGNTAERILPRLNCDILVLRAGFSEGLVPILKQ